MAAVPMMKAKYREEVTGALTERFGYSNAHMVPAVEKIVLNMGLGEAVQNAKIIDEAAAELTAIAGQRAVICRARRSIATYKLREGMPIGVKVTLRGVKMWDFMARLVHVAIPRVRDFKGMSPKAFDGRGNFSLGVTEQIIFPEIDYDKISKIRGLNITIVTSAKTDEEALALLKELGLPFRN
jgi:large subunit ribosomal protein L5